MNEENQVITSLNREIRSFVLRQGKITQGQSKALESLFPTFGIEYEPEIINLDNNFGRSAPKIIEIGFGMGNATWQIAKNNPQNDYLGIEVHLPGVGALLIHVEEQNIQNLRMIRHDAVEVLKNMIPDNSIDGFHVYFPDPWHKKRHHKRRIIQSPFVQLLSSKLKIGGYIHLATDWENYAHWMLDILNEEKTLQNTSSTNNYVERPEYRPITKFETRGIKLGHGIWDIIFKKI
ncbi:MAG: tRNA (guanosine(46)-N7)-methyltransferase TrmB [Burkholderiales bacterium]|nr:tRNA (guanosine(46)-N7)-methyltransferase TrmB [Burkholderiales bacterium]